MPNNGKNKGGKNAGPNTLRSTIRDLFESGLIASNPQKEINASARVRYAPILNEYEGQARASKAQTKRDKQYFNQYKQQLAGLRGETTQAYDNANAQLAQAAQAAGQQDTAILGALNANRQADASLMGAPASSGANPLAAAQANRSTMSLANQARTIGQGAAQSSYMTDQKRIAARAKIDQALKGEARTRSIRNDIEDVLREKGAFKEEARRDYRDADRGFLMDLLNTRQATQLQNDSQKFEASQAAKDRRAAKQTSTTAPDKKGHPDARDQKQDNKQQRQDAMALLRSDPPTGKHANMADIVGALVGAGIDPRIAHEVAKKWLASHKSKGGDNGGVDVGAGLGLG